MTYIVKPELMSQGQGIFITQTHKFLGRLPADEPIVVQRYLPNPMLIDGLKFDLRIYVLLVGIDPLRIYIYEDGMARFAT